MGDGSKKRVAIEEIMPNKRHKRFKMNARVEGGYAPSFKPITVDLDEEDQMIVDMKQKGYNDLTIAERLRAQGFTKYEPRSVSCRWARIRKKTQEYEEKLLDEELTDWHVGEVSHHKPCRASQLTDHSGRTPRRSRSRCRRKVQSRAREA